MQEQPIKLLDYRQQEASNAFLPQSAALSSPGWSDLHFELHCQPKFEIAEHQHTMHVIALSPPVSLSSVITSDSSNNWLNHSSGERWLDGKLTRERRYQGDIAIIPAGISHRCNWHSSVQFMILAIEPLLLQQVAQDWVNPDRIELRPQFMAEQDPLIQGVFSALKDEIESNKIGGDLLIDSLKTTLAIHLLRNYCTTHPRPSSYAGGLSSSTLRQVTGYIYAHLHQDIKLIELASIAQISQYHFLRLFKQSLGVTPHQYVLQCRIDQAKHLLQQSELSIAEIAVRVGFCDQSHLTRCFKRMLGITPRQLLQQQSDRRLSNQTYSITTYSITTKIQPGFDRQGG